MAEVILAWLALLFFMNTLLKALYELLSFITEDAIANKLGMVPPKLLKKMNELCIELGEYLDSLE